MSTVSSSANGIDADFFLEQTAATGMHACDYPLTVDMEMDVVDGYDFTNWERGYGNFHCQPDIGTLRRIDWLGRTVLLFCDLNTEGGNGYERVSIGPRTMLARQLARLRERGLVAKCGSELEYYIFKDSYDEVRDKGFQDLETAGWYLEDYHILQGTKEEGLNGAVRRRMNASGVPVEFSKRERTRSARNQLEICLGNGNGGSPRPL